MVFSKINNSVVPLDSVKCADYCFSEECSENLDSLFLVGECLCRQMLCGVQLGCCVSSPLSLLSKYYHFASLERTVYNSVEIANNIFGPKDRNH